MHDYLQCLHLWKIENRKPKSKIDENRARMTKCGIFYLELELCALLHT